MPLQDLAVLQMEYATSCYLFTCTCTINIDTMCEKNTKEELVISAERNRAPISYDTCMHTCMHTCTRTYMHAYIYTYVHTYKQYKHARITQELSQHLYIFPLNSCMQGCPEPVLADAVDLPSQHAQLECHVYVPT